jgi:hypothetical protein
MKEIKDNCLKVEPVGSRITCNPPPMDTDEDFLCLVARDKFYDLVDMLVDKNYDIGGSNVVPSEDYPIDEWEGFQSFKKGITNLIVTCSVDFFDRFMVATKIAKEKNLLLKEERIALFQYILYDIESIEGKH